jgi:hypothetical protein
VHRRLCVCCSYSETGIVSMLKSVARIRLVKAEITSVCVTVNSKGVDQRFTCNYELSA